MLSEDQQTLYDFFRGVAERGEPCPSPDGLARQLPSLVNDHNVKALTRELKRLAVFSVEHLPNNQRRVVFPDGVRTDWSLRRASIGRPRDPAQEEVIYPTKTDGQLAEIIRNYWARRGKSVRVTIGPDGLDSDLVLGVKQ